MTYASINPAGPAPATTTFSISSFLPLTKSPLASNPSSSALGDMVGDTCEIERFIVPLFYSR